MSRLAFEIDMIDTLKRSIKEISDSIINDPLYADAMDAAKSGATSNYSVENPTGNSIRVINHIGEPSDIIQSIKVDRFADGSQSIVVDNYDSPTIPDSDLVIDSARNVDVVFDNNYDDDDLDDSSSDDEDDDD